ncbi:MAG: Phosphatidylserine decarboxylase [Labilithrix sp.]|nr:Phosphatidylserine decarboxylase [Labilithrix sp.]
MTAITYATAQILRVLPRTRITRAMGRLADYAWPEPIGKAVVGLYCRAYNVELDECAKASGFTSFDEFFTRALRQDARKMPEDVRIAVSPADGRIDSIGPIGGEGASRNAFYVKGRPYQVDELVGDVEEARRYEGGTGCVVYLSPRDYHRVHSPVEGAIVSVRSMAGDYYPVNAIGVRHVHNLFVRNRRVAIAIDTPPESGLGRVTVVMVAAMVVGRITVSGIDARDVPMGLHEYTPPLKVARGDEIGIFRLGSTAVVFFERQESLKWLVGEGPVRFGQPFAMREGGGGKKTNGASGGHG